MQCQGLNQNELDPKSRAFYSQALSALIEAEIPFLIGGAYAFERYTGIVRHTKDLDIFMRPRDCGRSLEVFRNAGYLTELTAPHWLAKAFNCENFVDIIFCGANGFGEVDDLWFDRAVEAEVLGIPVLLCPVEETLASKAFVMARDRFDGADIAHLIKTCSDRLDWRHLLNRFGEHWRVLLCHLILFGFIYPSERSRIPDWILSELLSRVQDEMKAYLPTEPLCQGTLLSPMQYRIDIECWGYEDARLAPRGTLSPQQVMQWTDSLEKQNKSS